MTKSRPLLLTIGHSNRTLEAFLALLEEFEIRALADIRRFPGSRRFPQFHREALREALSAEGIEYRWIESLGGMRGEKANPDSPNRGLDSAAFRNYADHMGTEEFRRGVEELLEFAGRRATSIMCAEKVFSNCHRRLLCDFLLARGVATGHIVEPGRLVPHEISAGARISAGGGVTYP